MSDKEKVLNLIANKNDGPVSKLSLIENELKIVYFIAALDSYRSDSLLRPFPSDFVLADNKKDFDRLVCAALLFALALMQCHRRCCLCESHDHRDSQSVSTQWHWLPFSGRSVWRAVSSARTVQPNRSAHYLSRRMAQRALQMIIIFAKLQFSFF